jgi:hypothetical protein
MRSASTVAIYFCSCSSIFAPETKTLGGSEQVEQAANSRSLRRLFLTFRLLNALWVGADSSHEGPSLGLPRLVTATMSFVLCRCELPASSQDRFLWLASFTGPFPISSRSHPRQLRVGQLRAPISCYSIAIILMYPCYENAFDYS